MSINRNNYEAWFIDYTDGKLSAQQQQELFLFLQQNPDLKEELENFDASPLEHENAIYDEKELLKKPTIEITAKNYEGLLADADKKAVEKFVSANYPLRKEFEDFGKVYVIKDTVVFDEKEILKSSHTSITASNREWWMISALENTLSPGEKVLLENELSKNSSLRNEWEQYRNTVLVSPGVIFTGKDSLKRKDARVVSLFIRYTSYAAAACLLLFFGWKWMAPQPELSTGENVFSLARFNHLNNTENEKENPQPFIAEEKQEEENKETNNYQPVPTPVQPQNNNAVAVNDSPLEKVNKKNNPVISAETRSYQLVTTNIAPVDSLKQNFASVENEKENKTVTELAFGKSNGDFLTPKEYFVQQFNKRVLNKNTTENPTTEELATVASAKVTEATNVPVNITTGTEDEYKTYGFSIGKFGFSRTARKR